MTQNTRYNTGTIQVFQCFSTVWVQRHNSGSSRFSREEERRERERIPAGNSRIPIPKSRPGPSSNLFIAQYAEWCLIIFRLKRFFEWYQHAYMCKCVYAYESGSKAGFYLRLFRVMEVRFCKVWSSAIDLNPVGNLLEHWVKPSSTQVPSVFQTGVTILFLYYVVSQWCKSSGKSRANSWQTFLRHCIEDVLTNISNETRGWSTPWILLFLRVMYFSIIRQKVLVIKYQYCH